MKVYGIQFDPKWGDKAYNFQEIEQILESSEIKKGSLIILPETFATGFCLNTEITTKDEPKKPQHSLVSYLLDIILGLLAA